MPFEDRIDFADHLQEMCALFVAVAQEGDPRIDEYLEKHQKALAALSRMTGEKEE